MYVSDGLGERARGAGDTERCVVAGKLGMVAKPATDWPVPDRDG